MRRRLGLPPHPVRVYDLPQQLGIVDDDMPDRFGLDTVELGRNFALDDEVCQPWELPDGTPYRIPAWIRMEHEGRDWVIRSESGRAIARMPSGVLYWEQCHWPFLDEEEDLGKIREAFGESMWTGVASPPGPVDDATPRAGAARLRTCTDRAIVGLFGGNLMECGHFLYRIDKFLLMLAAEPERATTGCSDIPPPWRGTSCGWTPNGSRRIRALRFPVRIDAPAKLHRTVLLQGRLLSGATTRPPR